MNHEHMRHLNIFDAALSLVTPLLTHHCIHDSVEALFNVGTQLGECRYKFLRRWAQYGSHSGAQDWEINQ